MEQVAVETQSLTKQFPTPSGEPLTVLGDVSIAINDNEFFTLLGPSGCGKTTLLRLIAGFEQPSSGSVSLFGRTMNGLEPDSRPVNTVFQSYMLFPHMTVRDNVGFGLRMLGRPAEEISSRVAHMLRLVRLSGLEQRLPSQLSGGQQQRVALARALAPSPRVLLLDEPLSALDLKLRQEMRSELKNLQRETGITFVFVTHDQEEALTMSDRIAVLAHGRLQQIGDPVEIYERPVNRFVADFVGETNLIPAVVEGLDEASVTCKVEAGPSLAVDRLSDVSVGQVVTLSIRPEKIRLEAKTPDAPAGMAGRVAARTYAGVGTSYEIHTDGGLHLAVRESNDLNGHYRFDVGDTVTIDLPRGALRILED